MGTRKIIIIITHHYNNQHQCYYSSQIGSSACTECNTSFPQTIAIASTNSNQCLACPLGYYCPIGSSPEPCPFDYSYEPIGSQIFDRTSNQCIRKPCQEKYWCGSGAAEGDKAAPASGGGWSTAPLDLSGLRAVNANLKLTTPN